MRIPLSWLKEYIDINLPSAQIAKLLTSLGLEVDAVEQTAPSFEKVVVGKVAAVQSHPNAEKLRIATVTDGVENYQVVCGAPNCRAGIKTAFAKVGAKFSEPEGKTFEVKIAKLRGIESFGMLCSPKELGIGDDHDGIIEFSDSVKEGMDVAALYTDTVFEISLTPNLGHCSSLIGVARELSAATGLPVKFPPTTVDESPSATISGNASVVVQDAVKCPRYACRLVHNVAIGPSPDWLKRRLEACGLRSVNNVVDITNFVLLEWGHPLHAFDYDNLAGHQIVVRHAQDGELFTTLDGKERILAADDLLIADPAKAVAIAGVMGGQNSEVTPSTKNILIESAYFQPATIRRTSKRLGLQTDSSKRFERGCDPNNVLRALDRAAELMRLLAGGTVAAGVIDVKEQAFAEKVIKCRHSRLNALLGTQLSLNEVERIFERLNMTSRWDGRDAFEVKVPTYRTDVTSEIDLFEEVARIYGYDNIPKKTPRYHDSRQPHTAIFTFEREVRERLLAEGLQEFLTCDLIGPTALNVLQDGVLLEDALVKVVNPTSIEQSILRTTLLPGLLQVVKYNVDHQNHDISGFEIGRIHFKSGDQYKEQYVAAIILSGKSRPHHWDRKPADVDFYDLKGILENVFKELRIAGVEFKPNTLKTLHSGRQASIYVGSLEIGSFGEVHPAVQRRLDVPQRMLFAEFNLHDLMKVRQPEPKMKSIPVYPASERDWTVTLREETPIRQVLEAIRSIPSRLLESVELVALFRSDKLGPGKKNATFHFVYRDKEKTVEMEEVEREHDNLLKEALKLLEKW